MLTVQILAINTETDECSKADTLEEVIEKIQDDHGHDPSYINEAYEFFELDTATYFEVEFKAQRVMKPQKKQVKNGTKI